MKRKYPAPFDDQEKSRWDELVQLYDVPNAPLPPSAPLPVNIPVDKSRRRRPSLYRELFGDDTSVLAAAMNAVWATDEQRMLASQILAGRKSFHKLSTSEEEVLDGLARNFNEGGESYGPAVRQADSERLSVLREEEPGQEDDEDLSPEGESDLQSDVSPHPGAYDWLEEGGDR